MPTLADLFDQFDATEETKTAGDAVASEPTPAVDDGETKIASGGDPMNTLQDIYMSIADQDMDKTAAQVADVPVEEEVDFAKMAEDIAEAEAEELVEAEVADEDGGDIMKVAAEYDSAGRIMARGFYDEYMKLAAAMDTDVNSNQMTESPSVASTPSLGDRGLPTTPTNFAGNDAHDAPMETAGPSPKQVYADSLKPKKAISAGQGTEDDPEGKAVALGGGSPAGFATVRDLSGGKPA